MATPRLNIPQLLARAKVWIAAQDKLTLGGVAVIILFALYAFLREEAPAPPAEQATAAATTPVAHAKKKHAARRPAHSPEPSATPTPTEPGEDDTPDAEADDTADDTPEPDNEADDEPDDTPEPDAEADDTPDATPEPPHAEQTGSDSQASDTPAPAPEPGATPTPPTPGADDTPPAPRKTRKPPLVEESNPYASSYSLQGNKREMVQEWKTFMERLLSRADAEALQQATEYRIHESIPQLFSGKNLMYAAYRSSNTLLQAVELCYTIRHVGAKNFSRIIRPNTRGEDDGVGRAFMEWLLTDRSRPLHYFLQAFKLNSGRPEQLHYAIKTFYEIWKRSSERDRTRYLNLAIACSIVQESIAKAPCLLRDREAKPLSMPELYAYFVELDAHSKLLADIKKTSVSDLLYVVDVRLPKSEFEWVHSNIHYTRQEWGKTYESVTYLMERATEGLDPYDDYSFEEILEKGGICHDRSLYAANSAKCVGIPATYISGDGERGPHAWVGLLTAPRSWTSSGSYGYATGRFRNPCSGRFEHESMLTERDRNVEDDKLDTAANLLLLSEYACELGRPNEALMAAQYVSYKFPLLTAGWVSRIEVMKMQDEDERLSINLWKRLHYELTREASRNTELLDLAQEIQKDYILSNARDATKKSMLRLSTRQIEKAVEDSGRVDLLEESIARQAEIYAQAKDYRGLLMFYREYYKKYAEHGHIFGSLLRQHVNFLSELEDNRLWLALARDTEKLYTKNIYDGDYLKVKKDAEVMNTIADIYEKGGDSRRADKIRDDAQKALDKNLPKKKRR